MTFHHYVLVTISRPIFGRDVAFSCYGDIEPIARTTCMLKISCLNLYVLSQIFKRKNRAKIIFLVTNGFNSICYAYSKALCSNPAQARCARYNVIWSSLSVTCDRSVVFSVYSGFLHQ